MAAPSLGDVCFDGNLDEVKSILDSSPTPSQAELDDALSSAAGRGNAATVALLLSRGARVGRLSFLGAARSHSPAVFEEYRKHGWDVNSTEFGDAALRLVVADETCVRWFLDHGADPNLRGKNGATPLSTAALHPSITVLDLLISRGAELDPAALFNAMSRRGGGGVPVMKFLIERGIDVNTPSRQWGSPLHYAVRQGDAERVQLLLDSGADRTIKTLNGDTPAEMAEARGRMDLCELISG